MYWKNETFKYSQPVMEDYLSSKTNQGT